MFPEPRIPRALFLLLCCLLFSAGEEAVRLQELEGNTVTIHTGLTGVQSDQILWRYGSGKADKKTLICQVLEGKTKTDYSDRFRDRLQLNRSSGSLTIRNISREDSGVYLLQIITGNVQDKTFSVQVYAPVSKPVTRNQTGNSTGNHRESCSPECSVENGEDVSLSWYKEEERISNISGADSSDRLHLPLNITFSTSSTYTCVSANPVSSKTTQLNIADLCPVIKGQNKRNPWKSLIAVLLPVVFIITILVIVWVWIKRRKLPVSEGAEVNYAEVKIAPQKAKKVQNSKQEDNADEVMYASIKK